MQKGAGLHHGKIRHEGSHKGPFFNIAEQQDDPYEWLVRELDKWDLHWLVAIKEPTISRLTTTLKTEMENAVNIGVQLTVEMNAANNWLDAH